MKKKFYKVVHQDDDGKLWSCGQSYWTSGRDYIVQYKVGRKVFPTQKNSKLFVFGSLDAAKKFVYDTTRYVIYECYVTNPTLAKRISGYTHHISIFWELMQKNPHNEHLGDPALNNTYYVDSVVLTKKIV